MLEFHRVTRCPTWAAEASPCAGTSMPCNPIVPEVPFGGELLSVISPLLPLGEVDDEGLCRSTMPISMSAKGVHATEQLVDEGAVHLVCPGKSCTYCSSSGVSVPRHGASAAGASLARKTTKGVPKHASRVCPFGLSMEAISTTRCLSTMSMSMSAMVAAELTSRRGCRASRLSREAWLTDLQYAAARYSSLAR